MKSTPWNERFWASTRGRIILLLRRGSRTVTELAEALGLTDNAIRTHLTALERDGLVRQSGTRPALRKPQMEYDLTREADQLFPRIYGPLLDHLLAILKGRLAAEELEEVLRAVGRRLAATHRPDTPAGTLRERVEQAVSVLGSLGGLAEPEQADGKLVIRSFDCPLTALVESHPEVCLLVETFLADLIGAPVRQSCQRQPTPRCYFEVGTAAPC
jgi:predicted ArsR family transcriptional regulator